MNAETSALIEASGGWRELSAAAEGGRLPQSAGVVIPRVMQETFAEMYGRLVLGDDNLWREGRHPDMISAGDVATPPNIDDCRRLQGELALHPLSARRRLAVVWMAARLSTEASNSLLKITEEPPAHGNILFISEEDNFIPTIKSRIWLVHVELPEEMSKAQPMPRSNEEWARWMDVGRKPSPEILYLEMQAWARDFVQKNDYKKAAEIDFLVRIMEQRRLSVPVIEDLAFALFKEEVPNEQIFGGLW
ncbi:hypothetical protein [Synergistes jonesii]|uniref:Uncharacterized protein n=1 Tax=Synergistes jonesii TaxID=2754 RepID=A0A073J113_9BACT|nr:hypothetical protein [Synergistes jonesii]KEJ91382.1 hypothetical protein EH55_11095 [Synergistes jonesii]